MSKKYCIIFVALIMIFVSSCEFKANERKTTKTTHNTTNSTVAPEDCYDVQLGYYMEKTHFYRIQENGTITYLQKDGDWGNLINESPRGYAYVNFSENSKKVGSLSKKLLNKFNRIINNIINDKSDYFASDSPKLYIYRNNRVYEYCILSEKSNYKLFNELFDILNESTSVALNRSIY